MNSVCQLAMQNLGGVLREHWTNPHGGAAYKIASSIETRRVKAMKGKERRMEELLWVEEGLEDRTVGSVRDPRCDLLLYVPRSQV